MNNLSCQLGGLTLNGNVANGTAQNYNIITINDPAVIIQDPSGVSFTNNYIQLKIGSETYLLPLYQV